MSEDRTLEPSPRRLREARGRGLVASSAELTAAVGLLAAVAALGAWGDDLVDGMAGLVREAIAREDLAVADARSFLARVRGAIGAVVAPMAGILAVPMVASLAAHQVQVGGLFVPALALPDPSRLRAGAIGGSPGDRAGRAAGMVLRGAVFVALAWWTIRPLVFEGIAPPGADAEAMLHAAGGALRAALFRLGLGLLGIGLVHYAMQVRRVAARLRLAPEEHREEVRSQDGDPGLRARRRGAARRRQAGPAGVDGAAGPRPI